MLHLRIVAQSSVVEVGRDRAGRHGAGRDPARTELRDETAGEYLDAALHHGIGAAAGQRHACEAARQVHDAAAVGDQRQHLLRQE